MREIKFRIPHYDINAKFVQFSYWGYLDNDSTFTGPSMVSGTKKRKDEQYTGMKDKKGKEFCDGDIIEYTSCEVQCKGAIIWNEFCGAWQYQYKGALGGNPSDYLQRLLSNTRFPANPFIIGNIHENPELIEHD